MAESSEVKTVHLLLVGFTTVAKKTFVNLAGFHIHGLKNPKMTELKLDVAGPNGVESSLVAYRFEIRHSKINLSVTFMNSQIRSMDELCGLFPNPGDQIHALLSFVDCSQYPDNFDENDYFKHHNYYRKLLPYLQNIVFFIRPSRSPEDNESYKFLVGVTEQYCCFEAQFTFINCGEEGRDVPKEDKNEFNRFWEYLDKVVAVPVEELKRNSVQPSTDPSTATKT